MGGLYYRQISYHLSINTTSITTNFKAELPTMTSGSVKYSETMKKIDDNFRYQSHKLIDKFRKIRHPSKLVSENDRKLSDTSNNIVEERKNRLSPVPKLIQGALTRRQSIKTTPQDFQLPVNAHLKPKGILKSSTPNNSYSNIHFDSSQDPHDLRRIDLRSRLHFVIESENNNKNLLSSSLSNLGSSNQSSTIPSMKKVKHVTFHDNPSFNKFMSMPSDMIFRQIV
ncbi:hypothetical protein I4U23_009800 [Adineta vaga]|nr:hypothetical protein I4U23_009800 [Adineta vaga]